MKQPTLSSVRKMEAIGFQDIHVNEAKVEEFLRKNIGLIFDEEEGEETLLIVGQQVLNRKRARNDLVALDACGNLGCGLIKPKP